MDSPVKELRNTLNSLTDDLYIPDVLAASVDQHKYASYAYEVIMDRIKEFEDDLDDDHEVGMRLATFGAAITMAVTDIGYSNPNTLVFYGYVDGKRATLLQHMSQMNFLLVAVPKPEPEKPPRRIGFSLNEE